MERAEPEMNGAGESDGSPVGMRSAAPRGDLEGGKGQGSL